MVDIAPSLYEKVQERFTRYLGSTKIKNLKNKIEKGEATYKEANEYAVEVGEALKEAFKGIDPEELPDGKMYYNIADRVVRPHMEEEYEIVADAAEITQKALNEKAGLGLNAVRPGIDQNRIQGIIDRLSEAEKYEDVNWILGEPVVNYGQSVVNDTLFSNAKLHNDVGLYPKIIRTAEPPGIKTVMRGKKRYSYKVPCKWCANLAGTYEYADVAGRGNDVYRQHENCRCIIEYDPGNGIRERVAGKYYRQLDPKAIERRGIAELRTDKTETKAVISKEKQDRLDRLAAKEKLNNIFPGRNKADVSNYNAKVLKDSADALESLEGRYKAIQKTNATLTNDNALLKVAPNAAAVADYCNGVYELSLNSNIFESDNLSSFIEDNIKIGHFMPVEPNYYTKYIATHEYGHILEEAIVKQIQEREYGGVENKLNFLEREITNLLARGDTKQALPLIDEKWDLNDKLETLRRKYTQGKIEEMLQDRLLEIATSKEAIRQGLQPSEVDVKYLISNYGNQNRAELFAEAFINYEGGQPNIIGEAMGELLEEYRIL